jgi:hypothetical protein
MRQLTSRGRATAGRIGLGRRTDRVLRGRDAPRASPSWFAGGLLLRPGIGVRAWHSRPPACARGSRLEPPALAPRDLQSSPRPRISEARRRAADRLHPRLAHRRRTGSGPPRACKPGLGVRARRQASALAAGSCPRHRRRCARRSGQGDRRCIRRHLSSPRRASLRIRLGAGFDKAVP